MQILTMNNCAGFDRDGGIKITEEHLSFVGVQRLLVDDGILTLTAKVGERCPE